MTIRRLPDGKIHSAFGGGREGPQLRVTVTSVADIKEFDLGALVEVLSEKMLYLGEVVGRMDAGLVVSIEHTVDRAALAAIQSIWHGGPGDAIRPLPSPQDK